MQLLRLPMTCTRTTTQTDSRTQRQRASLRPRATWAGACVCKGTHVAVCCGSMAGTPQRTFRAVVWSWTSQWARTTALWAGTRTSSALTAAVFLLRPARLRWSETTGQACCGCGCVCFCVCGCAAVVVFVCVYGCVCLLVCLWL